MINKLKDSFIQTHWSLILAFDTSNPKLCDQAMTYLCETYWRPLFAFCRKKGYNWEAAEDLVQGFFTFFLEKKQLRRACPERGRFRTFLFTCFRHFLTNEWEKANAQKRGGNKSIVSIHKDNEDDLYIAEQDDSVTPEMVYEKTWALTLLRNVLNQLKEKYVEDGKGDLYDKIYTYLVSNTEGWTLKELADELGMNQNTLRINIFRCRKKLQKILIHELMQTLDNPEDIEEEIGNLYRALRY